MPTTDTRFSQDQDTLRSIAADALAYARQVGATAAEVDLSEGFGQAVTVRRGEVETIEYTRDKGLSVTVFAGQRRGNASTSDLAPVAIRATIDAALSIARHTAEDPFAGLADPERFARAFPDLDLYHPHDTSVDDAIALATRCEAAALDADPAVSNSEGASVHTQESQFVYANSGGFVGGGPGSRYSVSCSVIAGTGDAMQRDDWYSVARAWDDLEAVESVGRRAGERAAARVGARKLATREAPVLFDTTIASSLLGHFAGAASGGSLYRKSSFLLDAMGTQVFAPCVRIRDLARVSRGLASGNFDDEGVATQDRDIVVDGVLQGWFLGSYSARKLGLETTGNAGGTHNLVLDSTGQDFDTLLRLMGTGLLVTDLLGQGVNGVTGDYSRGAAGFWVENGAIAFPVTEITIASNLKDMYRGIVAVGTDVLRRTSRQTGSVLVEKMTIAGE
jgi:PmbA protein